MSDRLDLGREHVILLSAHLLTEVDELHAVGAIGAEVAADVRVLLNGLADADVDRIIRQYRRARVRIEIALDERYQLATAYSSMAAFWSDASAQEDGKVASSYWDSYEHGLRRRLEGLLAETFGSTEAVLVNSGMSALDVALRSIGLRTGDVLVTHDRAYFETSDYLDNVLVPTGVRVERTDLTNREQIRAVLSSGLTAVLIESVLNGPTCDIPLLEPLLAAGIPVILDNSVLSHGLPGSLSADQPSPVLVVESGSKYLSRQASSGVIYGWGELGRQARLTARRVGQQLQGRALHRLRAGEIVHCRHRLAVHAAHLRTFAETLRTELPALQISTAATGTVSRSDVLAQLVSAGANGCLLFVTVPEADEVGDYVHRAIVSEWATVTGHPVRAGFGWTTTAGRSYGRDPLNTDAGRSFIRLSIGLEQSETQRELAMSFAKITDKWTEAKT